MFKVLHARSDSVDYMTKDLNTPLMANLLFWFFCRSVIVGIPKWIAEAATLLLLLLKVGLRWEVIEKVSRVVFAIYPKIWTRYPDNAIRKGTRVPDYDAPLQKSKIKFRMGKHFAINFILMTRLSEIALKNSWTFTVSLKPVLNLVLSCGQNLCQYVVFMRPLHKLPCMNTLFVTQILI